MRRVVGGWRREVAPRQLVGHDLRGLFGAIHERHARTEHAGEQRFQKRVVRAAQDQHVHGRPLERRDIFPRDQLGRRVIEPSLLDERDEQGAGLHAHGDLGPQPLDGALVRAARDRTRRADHPDFP